MLALGTQLQYYVHIRKATGTNMLKQTQVQLYFTNDADEREHYGTFADEQHAKNVIAELQADDDCGAFATERFELVTI